MTVGALSNRITGQYGGLNTTYKFVQLVVNYNNGTSANPWCTQGAADTFGGLVFLLNDLPQASTFTALYDQYMIDWVEVSFLPCYSMTQAGAAMGRGRLIVTPDMDNAVAATSFNQIRQYNSAIEVEAYKPIIMGFKPRIAVSAYLGASVGYANQTSWIDCGYPSTNHYGAKWGLSAYSVSTAPMAYDLRIKYFIKFRNTI